MSATIREAALRLLSLLDAPKGAVNALPTTDKKGPIIRLLVLPEMMYRIGNVPSKIDGYRVSVEARGRVSTQA